MAVIFILLTICSLSAPAAANDEGDLTVVPQVAMERRGAISPDGRWFAGMDNVTVKIWDCKHQRLRLAVALPARCRRPVFRPGDNALLCNCGRYSLLIHPGPGKVQTISLPLGLSAFSHDGKRLAVAAPYQHRRFTDKQVIHLMDGRTFRTLKTWKTSEAVTAATLCFSKDDSSLEMTGEGGRPHARIYLGFPVHVRLDLKTGKLTESRPGKEEREKLVKHPHPPLLPEPIAAAVKKYNLQAAATYGGEMCLSPDHRTLVLLVWPHLEAWDLQTGRRIRLLRFLPKRFLGWTKDGFLTMSNWEGLHRWNPKTGKMLSKKMYWSRQESGHKKKNAVFHWKRSFVSMAPDGEHFLVTYDNKNTYMLRWSDDKPLWEIPDARYASSHLIWRGGGGWRLYFYAVGRREIHTVWANVGKVVQRCSVTRDDQERVGCAMQAGRNLLLGLGDTKQGHIDLYLYKGDLVRHSRLVLDKMGIFPLSLAYAPGDGSIYVGDLHGRIQRIVDGRKTASVNLHKIRYLNPSVLRLDPSESVLCASNDHGGVALDARTLMLPKQAACIARNGRNRCGQANPIPLSGSVAIFARPSLGRFDLVDIRKEQTILSLQSWGKDGWSAFTPKGKWIADKAGAARIVVYKGDKPLSDEDAGKLKQPKAVEAALKQIGRHPDMPGR